MQNILFISAGIALGLTTLSIIKLITDYRHVLSAKILIVFMLAGSSYVLAQLTPSSSNINILLDCFATTVSPLFLLFSLAFFQTKEEPFNLKLLHYVIFMVSVSLGAWVSFQQHGDSLHEVSVLIILNYDSPFGRYEYCILFKVLSKNGLFVEKLEKIYKSYIKFIP